MNKKQSSFDQFKNLCIEKFWFILLLLPLILIAAMIVENIQPPSKGVQRSMTAGVVGTVEISTIELAAIVAKPITELLAMEVYTLGGDIASSSSLQKQINTAVIANQLSEIRPATDGVAKLVSYHITKANRIRKRKESS